MQRSQSLASLAAVVALGSSAPADLLVVPDDQPTIQAAIDAAQAGDTILVRGGFHSQFTVDKALTVVADPRAVVSYDLGLGGASFPVPPTITLAGDGSGVVVLRNLDVSGPGFLLNGYPSPAYEPTIAGGGFEELHLHDSFVVGEFHIVPPDDCCHTGISALRTSVPLVVISHSVLSGSDSDTGVCQLLGNGGPPGIVAPDSTVVVLDSHVRGGGYYYFCTFGPCASPSFAASFVSPGIVAREVFASRSEILGGDIHHVLHAEPPFGRHVRCEGTVIGAPVLSELEVRLPDDLRASGALALGATWTLSWSPGGKPSFLLFSRAALARPLSIPAGWLFLDLDPGQALPAHAFPGSATRSFRLVIPPSNALIGVELFAQVLDTAHGLSRPVVDCIALEGETRARAGKPVPSTSTEKTGSTRRAGP